jgi:hypothetical protein
MREVYNPVAEPHLRDVSIWPTIQNSANTPAKNLVIYLNYYFPTDPMPTDFSFADLPDVVATRQVGGPHQLIPVGPRNLSEKELTDFRSGARHIYIFGHIEYDDGFKRTPHHTTRFCWEFHSLQVATDVPGVRWSFPYCARGNCIDEECKAQGLEEVSLDTRP